ncbi:hypothetical protein SAMN05444274_10545 [Mariniphaga anaerophila]|uniref:Xaa-Pro dipeptidyl-peptidase C-terminal domain-containing protein n=1 Tax=Mariniphaga anaerophila TaxID=1484053 RepID=A0A1M5B9R7_9BACT|nr:CocE/NonD family hydrolase [Mariniphaga anaerophila]SHF39165.1 hypothetical protein SAMN05444274_10545 [Mariniphaga anaerophila]
MTKKTLFFVASLIIALFCRGQVPQKINEYNVDSIKKNYTRTEIMIPMRDGVKLFTSIYSPNDNFTKYPIIIVRTPYGSESHAEEWKGINSKLNWTSLFEEKYILVFQDVRGTYMSEGDFMDIRPFNPDKTGNDTDENSDAFDTIDWLIKNINNNSGKVGMMGVSYPGFYSTLSLPNAHPALKAVSPQAPVTDWFIGDDWHQNGAFLLMPAFGFFSSFGQPRTQQTRTSPTRFNYNSEDNYNFFLNIGPVKNVTTQYFGDTIKFWNNLMNHSDYDVFWQGRNPTKYLTDIKPAVLVAGGWYDAEDLYGTLAVYNAIERQNPKNKNRLIMGPWSHGQWSRSGGGDWLGNIYWGSKTTDLFVEQQLLFFNYYLKGKGSMNSPEALVFMSGSNEWKSFDSWPPKNIESEYLYLQPNGELKFTPPAVDENFDEYVSDPDKPVPYAEHVHMAKTKNYMTDDQRFASRRPDVMVYKTDELTEDVSITGPINVSFFVSTSGTDADFVVKLIDVFPEQIKDFPAESKNRKTSSPLGGYQMLVRGSVLRGKYRNSLENPEPFVPGKITSVSFDMADIAHKFKKGHRIMIQVQNSWFPLVDRNPQKFVNIYKCSEEDFTKATQRIYHDTERPSHISIRVLRE